MLYVGIELQTTVVIIKLDRAATKKLKYNKKSEKQKLSNW